MATRITHSPRRPTHHAAGPPRLQILCATHVRTAPKTNVVNGSTARVKPSNSVSISSFSVASDDHTSHQSRRRRDPQVRTAFGDHSLKRPPVCLRTIPRGLGEVDVGVLDLLPEGRDDRV